MVVQNNYNANVNEEIMNAKDLKEFLHCGINRAYELMHSPAFPANKIGGSYRVRREAVIQWLKDHEGRNFVL